MLTVRDVRKSFGRVQALRSASMSVPRGQLTAIVGDNGAGKSTLVKCLVGVHARDGGEVLLDGAPVHFTNPQQARSAGIETVFQDLALVEDLTVAQNLFLSREETRAGFLDRRRMRREALDMVSKLAINVPRVNARVRRLSGGQRQAVSIARAAGFSSKLIVLDEPSAALGVQETARVEELIMELKSKGVTILLISHNFEQVLRLSDQVQVMRAGRTVAKRRTAETDGQELVGLVTGAILDPATDPEAPAAAGQQQRTGVRQMTQLGVHALVWSGTWDEAGARHAISSAAAAGFDLIEVPILDPFGIDTEMTRRLLDEYGLKSACSMGLPPHADVASEDDQRPGRGQEAADPGGRGGRGARRRGAVRRALLPAREVPDSGQRTVPRARGRRDAAPRLARLRLPAYRSTSRS